MKNAVALFVLLGLFSCSPHPFEGEISTTDSLSAVLDTMTLKLASINMEETAEIGKESFELQRYLSANYPDSADRNFWVNKMTPLYGVQRSLGKFLRGEPGVRKELIYTQEQLKTFRNSLKDEKLNAEEARKYLSQEIDAVAQISYFVNKYKPSVERSLVQWEMIKEEIREITDSVKAL